jgi:hypothetical protein
MALNENLDKRAFYAAFWNATNSVLVAAKRCAFRSKSNRDRGSPDDGDRVSFKVTTREWKSTYDLKATDASMIGALELKSVNSRRAAKVSLSKAK